MIQKLKFMDVAIYEEQATRAGLIFCASTEYYGIVENGQILAFAGLLNYVKKSTIKNIYVIESERGKGHFKALMAYFLTITKGKTLEANCTSMSLGHFLTLGFKQTKLFKNGITQVKYENLP